MNDPTPVELATIAAALCPKEHPTDEQLIQAVQTARRLLVHAQYPPGQETRLSETRTVISDLYTGANAYASFMDFIERQLPNIPGAKDFKDAHEFVAYHGERGWEPALVQLLHTLQTRHRSETNRKNARSKKKAPQEGR